MGWTTGYNAHFLFVSWLRVAQRSSIVFRPNPPAANSVRQSALAGFPSSHWTVYADRVFVVLRHLNDCMEHYFELMLPQRLSPTPYREVNNFLSQLLARQQAILGEHFVGLYLGGSLALGAFNLQHSDIDFLVVTSDHLPLEVVSGLQDLHAQLRATHPKWANRLDGSYVPREVVRHWTVNHAPCPFVEGDQFQLTPQGSAVIQRHIIREYGLVLAGPDPQDFIEPVSADEMRGALRDMVETWWRPELDSPSWVTQTRNQPFAILTLCRSLYVFEHGVVASKALAARWAQQALGKPWIEPIEWALTWPRDPESDHTISTLNLIAYTLDRFRQIDK